MIELSENISGYILKHFGEEYLQNYLAYSQSNYNPYLRIAPNTNQEKLIDALSGYGIKLENIPEMYNAQKIVSGDNLTGKTLEFVLGKYYLQSLSSMIPPIVLNPLETDKVLDLCAAPGSKTTQLAELMNYKGTLIANEVSVDRLKSLVFNVDKMNLANVGILQGKGELLSKKYQNYFDKILVDAPCSGLGIIQKKGEVSNWWNENKLVTFTELQTKLLISAIKMCKPGGEIVYSTCTISIEENEFVLSKVLENYPVELVKIDLPVKSQDSVMKFGDRKFRPEISYARRILPWEINSEGFFISKLRKTDATEKSDGGIKFSENSLLVNSTSGKIKSQLEILAGYYGIEKNYLAQFRYLMRNKDIYFINKDWQTFDLDSFVRIGSKLGSIEKRGYIQLHTLAAQIFSDKITKNIIELNDKSDIEKYLKGGIIKKDFGETGQKIVKFRNEIIGTAVVSKEGLKSQFPREYRTQEIVVA